MSRPPWHSLHLPRKRAGGGFPSVSTPFMRPPPPSHAKASRRWNIFHFDAIHMSFTSLAEVFILPRLFQWTVYGLHMDSTSHSIWNPWNGFWLRLQPFSHSMDTMDSIWNDHGINPFHMKSITIPCGIHMDSIWNRANLLWISWNVHGISMAWLHMVPHGFHGMSMEWFHMKSMECPWNDSTWSPWNVHGLIGH